MQAMTSFAPDTGINTPDNKETDTTIYYELTNEINLSEAVYVILNLRDYMGTIQAAFDEYLCSLQLGIDLRQYLARMEEYKKEKQQKLAEKGLQHIITSADIEEKMLEVLQSMKRKQKGHLKQRQVRPHCRIRQRKAFFRRCRHQVFKA